MEISNNTQTLPSYDNKIKGKQDKSEQLDFSAKISIDADIYLKSQNGNQTTEFKAEFDYDLSWTASAQRPIGLEADSSSKALENKQIIEEEEELPRIDFSKQLDEFQAEIRKNLLDSIMESLDPNTKSMLRAQFDSEHVIYDVEEGTEAAEVPEYWNSENTSQRIVDFAMSFADENSSPEFLEELRGAVMEGFAQAKEILGEIPGESGKLFNDTYESAMAKFDELMDQDTEKEASPLDQLAQMSLNQAKAQQNYQSTPATSAPSSQLELVA